MRLHACEGPWQLQERQLDFAVWGYLFFWPALCYATSIRPANRPAMASLLPFKQCTSPLLRAQAYHHPALFSACSTSRAAHVRPARATADDKDSNPFLGASGQASASPSTSTSTKTSSDVRVESLEKAIRGGKRSNSGSNAAPRRQIPIRGVNQLKVEQVSEEFAPWKEGQLFPEGWDNMPLSQKLSELYMGQRGVLFW